MMEWVSALTSMLVPRLQKKDLSHRWSSLMDLKQGKKPLVRVPVRVKILKTKNFKAMMLPKIIEIPKRTKEMLILLMTR